MRRVSCVGIFLIVAISVAPPLASIAAAAAPDDPRLIEAGRSLYEVYCEQCHGVEGNGVGAASERLDPTPRDFTSGAFKIRTTPSGELPTDEDLAAIIRRGMPYTGMPAWASLDDGQIASLVAYIETFNEDFADPEMRVPPIEIPDPPPFSTESASRGREVYLGNKCFECHGKQGRGDGPSAPTLTDDRDRPIRPADLTRRWTFRGGGRRVDIYRTFTTGLNGTPMPSYEDSISEEERWQLVDYVHSLSRDEPDYGMLVVAKPVEAEIGLDPSSAVFSAAEPTLFAMMGQVTDPGRQFMPVTSAVEVRAVYDAEVLAIEVSWHVMVAGREGANRPDGREPPAEGASLSDAIAIQIPAEFSTGAVKPYFLYGDLKNGVDLWFYDAARDASTVYRGNGEASVVAYAAEEGPRVRARGVFDDGRWRVVFTAPRGAAGQEGALRFPEAAFVPIAFSAWAGHAGETGNRRAVSGWYHLYLAPPASHAGYALGVGVAALALIAELLIAARVRRARREGRPQP